MEKKVWNGFWHGSKTRFYESLTFEIFWLNWSIISFAKVQMLSKKIAELSIFTSGIISANFHLMNILKYIQSQQE